MMPQDRIPEFKVRGAAVAGTHVEQLCLSGTELFHDRADVVIRNFNHQKLHRLQLLAVFFLKITLGRETWNS